MAEGVEIRSFRVCFKLERRLHRIDRWRIPLPYGMPVRGILYAGAVLAAVLIAERLPLLSALLGVLHPILRYGFLPIGAGYLLTELRLDGRAGHTVVRSWLRHLVTPRRMVAFRRAGPPGPVRLDPVVVAPDERDPRLRRAVIRGQGRIDLLGEAELRPRWRTLHVRAAPGATRRGKRIMLKPGQRVVVG